jgi:hypothetical protein
LPKIEQQQEVQVNFQVAPDQTAQLNPTLEGFSLKNLFLKNMVASGVFDTLPTMVLSMAGVDAQTVQQIEALKREAKAKPSWCSCACVVNWIWILWSIVMLAFSWFVWNGDKKVNQDIVHWQQTYSTTGIIWNILSFLNMKVQRPSLKCLLNF